MSAPSVFLLKRDAVESLPQGRARLPYQAQHLAELGYTVRWSDAHLRYPWTARPVAASIRALEGLGVPTTQTALAWHRLASSDFVLAVFESQGAAFATARALRIPGARTPTFGIVSCWLAELLPMFPAHHRAAYRWAYRHVDRLLYFSSNQTEIYREHLGIPNDRLLPIQFGIDEEFFDPDVTTAEPGSYWLAVGRDLGRDWPTTFEAARRSGVSLKVLCREADIAGLTIPSNVEVIGYVSRDRYRRYLAGARGVLCITEQRAYPTGQSVVLEAMAMGRCCIVTDTPAMRDYVVDGDNALTVPLGNAHVTAERILEADHDDELRTRIGRQAHILARQHFTARRMWSRIMTALESPVGSGKRTQGD